MSYRGVVKYRPLLGAPLAALFVACAVGTGDEPGAADPTGAPEVDASTTDASTADRSVLPADDAGADGGGGIRDSAPAPDGSVTADSGGDSGGDSGTIYACTGTVDFESGAAGYTHHAMDGYDNTADNWPLDEWATGAAANGLGCHSGTSCFATSLTQNYVQCARGWLRSPAIDLTTCASAGAVKVAFQHAYAFWTGAYNGTTWYDGGIVEISGDGGSTWQLAPGIATTGTVAINPDRGSSYACFGNPFYVSGKAGFVGQSSGWQAVEITIPAALRTSKFMIRFAYAAGVSYPTTSQSTSRLHTAAGWHVDDVQIVAQ